jgi:beta-glucoside operon transcriptional antiterminator
VAAEFGFFVSCFFLKKQRKGAQIRMARDPSEKAVKISRIINNNIISAFDENGLELIMMGRGIGFSRRPGEMVKQSEIEKVFRIENEKARDDFKDLVKNIPLEYLQISDAVITKAKMLLGTGMNQNVYLTLTDHISFAIDRFKKGMSFRNPLEDEVRTFYPTEYGVGCEAVKLIRRATGLSLPKEEAVSVALHIVDAEYNTQANDILKVSKLMQRILEIVEEEFGSTEHGRTLVREDLSSYVKYLCLRAFSGKLLKLNDEQLYAYVCRQYSDEVRCSERILRCIEQGMGKRLTTDEQAYLILQLAQIRRILQENPNR